MHCLHCFKTHSSVKLEYSKNNGLIVYKSQQYFIFIYND